MTWQPPAGYTRRVADVEAVVLDMVQPLLDSGTPAGLAVTWWPDNTADLVAQGIPLVRARKVPGITEADSRLVLCNVLLSVRTGSRADSWAVLQYLTDEMFRTWHKGGPVDRADGSKTVVHHLEVAPADQQVPELDPDYRVVSNTITVTLRRTA